MFFIETGLNLFREARAKASSFAALLALAFAVSGCGSHSLDASDPVGKQGIIDATNNFLTSGDCLDAWATIEPLFDSAYTDNNVRLITASALGCSAGINFIDDLNDIASAPSLAGAGFWQFTTQFFPSSPVPGADKVVETGEAGLDALMSAVIPGLFIVPQFEINITTPNPGSLITTDRINDANLYMVFMSMAVMGGIQNRFGHPDTSFNKQQNLPWTTATATVVPTGFSPSSSMATDGCAYAAAILNFRDSMNASLASLSSNQQGALSAATTIFGASLDNACEAGCLGGVPVDPTLNPPPGGWVATGCALPAGSCTPCPITLRNRLSCTELVTDVNSCAAAGLANYVNLSLFGWPGP